MKKTPTRCPACSRDLPLRRLPPPRYSALALGLFAAAALVTIGWIAAIFTWSPVYLVPRGGRGFLLCAIVYLAPGLIIGAIATRLPRVRTLRCPACGWSEAIRSR